MNNKGTTIIELIISIALLSIVMIFMYRLLADLTFERDSEYFASKNQETRIEIEQAINNELFKCYEAGETATWNASLVLKCDTKEIMNYVSTSSSVSIIIKTYSDYTSSGTLTETTTYDLKKNNVSKIEEDTSTFTTYKDVSGTEYTIKQVKLMIYTENSYNKDGAYSNNTIDDIVFSYISS